MRQLIRTYSITGNHEITVTGYTFTKQDIRLIIDETLASAAITTEDLVASVLVSSTKKGNVVTVQNGVITLASTTANLTVGDELTIEIDIDNVAKTSDIPTVQQIQNGLATESNATSNKNAIITAINGISIDTSNLATKNLEQFFGIASSYEAEAKGAETTDNTVINECKTRYAEVFGDLLSSSFVMPNSVTIDGTTYSGTVS